MASVHTIDIQLRELTQLFDSLDPSPFRQKSLDRNAENYLVEYAGEFPAKAQLRVLVHGPPSLQASMETIAEAIHRHFDLLSKLADRRRGRRRRIGRVAMSLGLGVLASALLLRSMISDWPGPVGEVLAEGLLILAWVALWRPAEMAMFDQWESRDHLRLLRKLARVSVEFAPDLLDQ